MLFRAIKHQVDKGPVDAVTGKAKYTLNDNRLLREDLEYRTLVRTKTCFSLDTLFRGTLLTLRLFSGMYFFFFFAVFFLSIACYNKAV